MIERVERPATYTMQNKSEVSLDKMAPQTGDDFHDLVAKSISNRNLSWSSGGGMGGYNGDAVPVSIRAWLSSPSECNLERCSVSVEICNPDEAPVLAIDCTGSFSSAKEANAADKVCRAHQACLTAEFAMRVASVRLEVSEAELIISDSKAAISQAEKKLDKLL